MGEDRYDDVNYVSSAVTWFTSGLQRHKALEEMINNFLVSDGNSGMDASHTQTQNDRFTRLIGTQHMHKHKEHMHTVMRRNGKKGALDMSTHRARTHFERTCQTLVVQI